MVWWPRSRYWTDFWGSNHAITVRKFTIRTSAGRLQPFESQPSHILFVDKSFWSLPHRALGKGMVFFSEISSFVPSNGGKKAPRNSKYQENPTVRHILVHRNWNKCIKCQEIHYVSPLKSTSEVGNNPIQDSVIGRSLRREKVPRNCYFSEILLDYHLWHHSKLEKLNRNRGIT